MNKVIITGRTTKDLEVRITTNNKHYVQFTLAVEKRVNGEKQADFVNCVAWNQLADLMNTYVHKGNKIGLIGRLSTRNYDDTNVRGKKVYVTEVVADEIEFLENKKQETTQQNETYEPSYTTNISSDDLPF